MKNKLAFTTGALVGSATTTLLIGYVVGKSQEIREEREVRVNRIEKNLASRIDKIVLSTKSEAEEVLRRMGELIGEYGQITVGDLNEMVGLETSYIDDRWGWKNVDECGIKRVYDGYSLLLPKPVSIV